MTDRMKKDPLPDMVEGSDNLLFPTPTIKGALTEFLIRTGFVIGTLSALYGAIEVAKYYRIADYFR